MQCRQPSLEGTGEIKLRRLVKEALRMRPSRIVVGEVRQEESFDLLIVLHRGFKGLSCRRRSVTGRDLVPHHIQLLGAVAAKVIASLPTVPSGPAGSCCGQGLGHD